MDAPENGNKPLALLEGQAHVWCAQPDQIADPDKLRAFHGLLDSREKRRQARYLGADKRHEFLVSHALVRSVLSQYADVLPASWTFEINEHGKPEISPARNPEALRFNLAHTRGLCACAVAKNAGIGVDLENLERPPDMRAVRRFFARPEIAQLESLAGPDQHRRFYELWTLKEAYVKARGQGLSIGLDRFWFLWDQERPPAIAFGPGVQDCPEEWRFFLFSPTPAHVAALAIRRPDAKLFVRMTLPFAS